MCWGGAPGREAFKDKNALARARIDRHIEVEDDLFDDLLGRAKVLSEDPLQAALIGVVEGGIIMSRAMGASH